jgi:hypothetical protein
MDERTNPDPRELSPRKKAFAQEILRRRREAKNEGWGRKHAWLAATAAAFSIGVAVISRFLAPSTGCGATPSFVTFPIITALRGSTTWADALFSGIKVASTT